MLELAVPTPAQSGVVRSRRWFISQIGSREHYACPVSFQRHGTLGTFYTDAWCGRGRGVVARLPRPWRGLSQRYHAELPRSKVVAFTAATVGNEMAQRLRSPARSREAAYLRFAEFGQWFASRVAARMGRLELDAERDVHFAYNTGALESVLHARQRGMIAIVDQIDAGRAHEQAVDQERALRPGWEELQGAIPSAYYARLSREWEAADLVVVNSNYSRRAVHAQGVALEKIVVVPLAYEPRHVQGSEPKKISIPEKPLQVLWLGQVALAKGIAYLLEAAEKLRGENIQFTVVGSIRISPHALKAIPGNVRIIGPVLHDQTAAWYRQADVFVLPTISDGFAITQIEAMAQGLPVVTTPNCGDVVTHGVNGLIVPIRDADALAAAIARLGGDRGVVQAMSEQAIQRSQQFSLEQYCTNLEDAVHALRTRQGRG